jgi:hypothetical protein
MNAVNAPIQVINNNAVEEYSNTGEALNNKYTPAVLYFYLILTTTTRMTLRVKLLLNHFNHFFNINGH